MQTTRVVDSWPSSSGRHPGRLRSLPHPLVGGLSSSTRPIVLPVAHAGWHGGPGFGMVDAPLVAWHEIGPTRAHGESGHPLGPLGRPRSLLTSRPNRAFTAPHADP